MHSILKFLILGATIISLSSFSSSKAPYSDYRISGDSLKSSNTVSSKSLGKRFGKRFGKLFHSIFNDSSTSCKPKLVAYPILGYAPETRLRFGLSTFYAYHAKQNPNNRLSKISVQSFLTQEKQHGIQFIHAFYTDESKWLFFGRGKAQFFPLDYYGVGSEAPIKPMAKAEGHEVTVNERIFRKVRKDIYFGLVLDYNQLSNVNFKSEAENLEMPAGSTGSRNYGGGFSLMYDTRKNILNARHGAYTETGFIRYDSGWGSDFSYTSYFFDSRIFLPVAKDQVWATQVFFNMVNPDKNSNVPFNRLAFMGGEYLMRGYYSGRFRDRVYTAAQTEYRFLPFPFSRRIGATFFGGIGTVAHSISELNMSKLKPAAGAGFRALIFPSKDIFLRVDAALTPEGLGYYIFIGEAF